MNISEQIAQLMALGPRAAARQQRGMVRGELLPAASPVSNPMPAFVPRAIADKARRAHAKLGLSTNWSSWFGGDFGGGD